MASKFRIQASLMLAYAYVPVPFAPLRNRGERPLKAVFRCPSKIMQFWDVSHIRW